MSKAAIDVNNLPYADGDFFAFEQLLSAKERDRLAEVREFLAREVKPIAVDCWNRAEFPMDLIPKLAEIDLVRPSSARVTPTSSPAYCTPRRPAPIPRSPPSWASTTDCSPAPSRRWPPRSSRRPGCRRYYSMKKIGAFGLTEPLGWLRRRGGTRTTARREFDHCVPQRRQALDRQRHLLRLGGHLRRDVEDNQVKGFLVDTKTEGYGRNQDREQDLAAHGPERGHHVGKTSWFPTSSSSRTPTASATPTRSLKVTRLSVAWQAVGQQLAAFDVARRYAVERSQFRPA